MRPRSRQQPKSSLWRWNFPGSVAIAGIMATTAIVAPVRATVLDTWVFDSDTHQLTVILPDDVTPNYFLLAEPARIVLDLPGTTLGNVLREQEYAGAIRSIRFSEILGGSRVVVELAPNTVIDPRHAELVATDADNGLTRWTLQPLIQDGEAITPIAAASTTSPAAIAAVPDPDSQANVFEDAETWVGPAEETAILAEPGEDSVSVPHLPPRALSAEAVDAEPTETVEAEPSDAEGADANVDAQLPDSDSEPDLTLPIAVTPPEPGSSDSVASPTEPTLQVPSDLSDRQTANVDDPSPLLPEVSSLPAVAHTATTGAAQALPSGPDPLQGVRTDAAALANGGEEVEVGSTLPADELPPDSLTGLANPTVSVPPLGDRASSPTAQVTVPSLTEVPEVPSVPDAVDLPVAEVGESPVVPPAHDDLARESELEAEAIVTSNPDLATASSIPTPEPDSVGVPPSPEAIRPPQSDATGSPPTNVPSVEEPPALETLPAPADAVAPIPPPDDDVVVLPPPPTISTTEGPQTQAAMQPPVVANSGVSPVESPPFLAEAAAVPEAEEPSIPPPPISSQSGRVVPFGTPLPPQGKTLDETATSPVGLESSGTIPVGTQLVLQYPGAETLTLTQQEPWYEVLVVAEDVLHPVTNERLLLKGTQVIGRFEGLDDSDRRFVSQVFVEEGGDRRSLLAESDWLVGSPQPNGSNLLTHSGIGAAALTVLSGFSGIGLIGGAALGAASSFATAPQSVTIEPGQLIRVEVVSVVSSSLDEVAMSDVASVVP
ncbi:MAG: AMIN domain-containing protein [Cyanobacteria bacterium P01_F01_bin.86]